jgi:hypothetical protein
MCPVVLANTAVIFAISGVSGQVQLVLYTPMLPVQSEQAVLIGFFFGKAGNSADDFFCFFALFGTDALDFENLRGKGKVDSAGGDGGSNNTPTDDFSV